MSTQTYCIIHEEPHRGGDEREEETEFDYFSSSRSFHWAFRQFGVDIRRVGCGLPWFCTLDPQILNSELHSLPYYLRMTGWRKDRFIYFPKNLCECNEFHRNANSAVRFLKLRCEPLLLKNKGAHYVGKPKNCLNKIFRITICFSKVYSYSKRRLVLSL